MWDRAVACLAQRPSPWPGCWVAKRLWSAGARTVPQVLEAVFAYISMLRASAAARGPDSAQERLFREVQTIENIDFLFGEEESAADWVEMLSINMHVYPPQDYITGPKLYFEFDAKVGRWARGPSFVRSDSA